MHTNVQAANDNSLIAYQALGILSQKRTVLETVNAEDYIRKLPAFFNGSIGAHIRHSLDHFQSLLTAMRNANDTDMDRLVDYDTRKRNTDIETDIAVALRAVQNVELQLRSLSDKDLGSAILRVSFIGEIESGSYNQYTVSSQYWRELSFVSHHAVHHLSMMKVMLTSMGYELPAEANIGVAFSTVKDIISGSKNSALTHE